MTIFFHELRQNRLSLMIWSAAIAFMLGICVIIYPEMSSQMGDISAMFADMGSFSEAFGMNELNFGEFMGYFAIECGNVLGIGGALFAALTGVTVLSKEEKEHTAEFLLTHPLSRARIIAEKLAAVIAQITLLNVIVIGVTSACIVMIDADCDTHAIALMFLAYWMLQIEIAAVTFAVSACIKRGSVGIGLGLAITLYFLNLVANLTQEAEFLKYITPFSYTDGATIIDAHSLEGAYLIPGLIYTALGIAFAFWYYRQKDIS